MRRLSSTEKSMPVVCAPSRSVVSNRYSRSLLIAHASCGWPHVGVMVGMLIGAHRGEEGCIVRVGRGLAHVNCIKPPQPWILRANSHLHDGLYLGSLIERGYRQVDPTFVFPCQRCSAIAAEATLCDVRADEIFRSAACPGEAVGIDAHEKAKRGTGGLLTHPAIADAGFAERANWGETSGPVLAAAGPHAPIVVRFPDFLVRDRRLLIRCCHRANSQVVTISPVAGSLASLRRTPLAASSSRMRSASLKFFDLRASPRCATSDFTRTARSGSITSTTSALWPRALQRETSKPRNAAEASHFSPAMSLPPFASLASSCRRAMARGVFRSSWRASRTPESHSKPFTNAPPSRSLISPQRSSVACDSSKLFFVQSMGWR